MHRFGKTIFKKFLGARALMLGRGCRPLLIHGRPQDFFYGWAIAIRGLGRKFLSGVQGWSPGRVWGQAPRSRRQVVKIMNKLIYHAQKHYISRGGQCPLASACGRPCAYLLLPVSLIPYFKLYHLSRRFTKHFTTNHDAFIVIYFINKNRREWLMF